MELAEQIRNLRVKKNLSQDELAQKIYVSRQTISNWENDKTYPDVQSLLLLSTLFDTTVDDLIKGDVKAMKDMIDNKELSQRMTIFSCGGIAAAFGGFALLVAGNISWGWGMTPSLIIFLLMWGIGMTSIWQVERMKKKYDLVTYKEILAFCQGEPVDRGNQESLRAREHRIIKQAISVITALVVGAMVGYFLIRFLV